MSDPDFLCPACRHPLSHHRVDRRGMRYCTRALGEVPVGCQDCEQDWDRLHKADSETT